MIALIYRIKLHDCITRFCRIKIISQYKMLLLSSLSDYLELPNAGNGQVWTMFPIQTNGLLEKDYRTLIVSKLKNCN